MSNRHPQRPNTFQWKSNIRDEKYLDPKSVPLERQHLNVSTAKALLRSRENTRSIRLPYRTAAFGTDQHPLRLRTEQHDSQNRCDRC